MAFTRDQIDGIQVGSQIAGRWGDPSPVVEIFGRGVDVAGAAYVCGYRQHGENGRISFSIKEGDETDAQIYRIL